MFWIPLTIQKIFLNKQKCFKQCTHYFEFFSNILLMCIVQATIKINYFCFLPRKMSHKPLGKFESKQVIINSVASLQKNLKKNSTIGFFDQP